MHTAEEVKVKHALHWIWLPVVEYGLRRGREDLAERRHIQWCCRRSAWPQAAYAKHTGPATLLVRPKKLDG